MQSKQGLRTQGLLGGPWDLVTTLLITGLVTLLLIPLKGLLGVTSIISRVIWFGVKELLRSGLRAWDFEQRSQRQSRRGIGVFV